MTLVGEKMRVSKLFVWCGVALLLCTTACRQQPPDTRAADEQTIRNLDAQWAKTAATRDLDAIVAYYSDDAVLLPPNEPIAAGKQAIRATWASLISPNTLSISWQPTRVDVSKSGDLAYLVGTYSMAVKDAKGKTVPDRGKLIEVFRKQPDGTWKTVADMFNSDLPPPPA
jgi:uncharacterized protein (TIGR02246 family)